MNSLYFVNAVRCASLYKDFLTNTSNYLKMNLILFRKIVISSSLTEVELLNRLSEMVDLEKSVFSLKYANPSKKYVGKVEGKTFKIYRKIKGRNSFIPIIQGTIIDNIAARNIKINMRLHFAVILFLLWVSGFLIWDIIKRNDYNGLLFIGLLFGMTILFFNLECNKSIKDLKEISIS